MRKFRPTLFIFLISLIAGRAGVFIEQKADDSRHSRNLTTRIQDDKMRVDVQRDTNVFSIIINLDTRDSLTLMPDTRTYMKLAGAEQQRAVESKRKAAGTNALEMDAPAALAVKTGRTEKIGGFTADIYTWSGARSLKQTLWVVTNFPGYDAIRTELAKVDRYNHAGSHRNSQPDLSLLPGMVVRTEINAGGQLGTNTLVSAKTGAQDPSLFELPSGYTAWTPAPMTVVPKPATKTITP